MRKIFPFFDFLYVLQLEEYYPLNYFRRLPRFFFRRNLENHDRLNWTFRTKLTFLLALAIFLIFLLPALSFRSFLFAAILLAVSALLIPVWVGLANAILDIPSRILKARLRNKARDLARSAAPEAKIIAVAGSFGKTTTKNFIYQLIRFNYRVQMVEGNINTPTGIAQWLLKNLDRKAEVILVEMDAYEIGEIAKSCAILPPNIAVLTNVGDQHLIRFGDRRNMAEALLETIRFSKNGAAAVVPTAVCRDLDVLGVVLPAGRELHAIPDEPEYLGAKVSDFENSPNRHSLALALKVAELLKIPESFVRDTARNLNVPARRHQFQEKDGYALIDDSYNISLATAKYGVASARSLADKLGLKLVVVTGGIPESGPGSNREYGAVLARVADHLVLMRTVFEPELAAGLGEKKHLLARGLADAWEVVRKNFRSGEVLVLLQPELTDLHY